MVWNPGELTSVNVPVKKWVGLGMSSKGTLPTQFGVAPGHEAGCRYVVIWYPYLRMGDLMGEGDPNVSRSYRIPPHKIPCQDRQPKSLGRISNSPK